MLEGEGLIPGCCGEFSPLKYDNDYFGSGCQGFSMAPGTHG